ncbi:MAG: beta-lactamase family protein [Acidobacteria bacterium]|nr:beta-lactamase family protein [Acidobacteriota bacterium]MXX86492.1 beta-lactamase family protein [Acidobacteriota bacterium]MYE44667.1 beta-lactamase family protein [Acidobacteriota bacterium]MYF76964.1 beta-lactamase family protein [Acidobacteriota bacterium]
MAGPGAGHGAGGESQEDPMIRAMPSHPFFALPALATFAVFVACGSPPADSPAHSGRADGTLAGQIHELAQDALRDHPAPGISIGVQRGGEVVFAGGFGYADLENEVPATADTVYRIGSVTKQFTAAAAMLLVEEGKLDLSADLTEYLPDYNTHGFEVTVERLLNHTSGIKGYTEMPEFWERSRLDLGHEAMLELFSEPPFEFEPGDRYQYNNSGYYLLGVLIERLSGMSYTEFLEARLFGPLGLERTHYLRNGPLVRGRAEGYEVGEDGGFVNDEPLSMELPYAAGSLGASVLDLLAWQRALAQGQAVSPPGYERMTARGSLVNGDPVHYGYGLSLGEEHGLARVSHGGGINGFRAQLALYPEEDLGIAVLINAGSGRPGLLANRIARAALGMEQPEVTEIEVPESELRRCAGTYNPGRGPVTLRFEDGSLFGFGERLVPAGDGVFHPDGDPFTRIVCESGPDGAAPALTLTSGGVTTRYPRALD